MLNIINLGVLVLALSLECTCLSSLENAFQRSIISSEEVDKNFEVYSPPDTNYSPSPIVEPYYSSEDDIETDNDDILSVDNENINEVHKAVTSVIKNHSQNSTTASIALALAALAMPVVTKIVYNHWRSFIAGAICCSFSHFVAVPIDVVKTRIQCNPDQYSNAFEVLIQILRSNGLGGLFSGSCATLLGYGLQGALKFGFYEALKPKFAKKFQPLHALILSSALADMIGSCTLAPMEAARIRMVSDTDFSGLNLVQSFSKLSEIEGFQALFWGLPALLCRQMPYTVTQLVSFELLTRAIFGIFESDWLTTISMYLIRIGCALVSGILASVASQPGDCLLSAVNSQQKNNVGTNSPESLLGIAYRLGLRGMFRGLQARIAHVSTIVMVQLTMYSLVKDVLSVKKRIV